MKEEFEKVSVENYTKLAMRTNCEIESVLHRLGGNEELLHTSLGFVTESTAELLKPIYKGFISGGYDVVNIMEEVSDIYWYAGLYQKIRMINVFKEQELNFITDFENGENVLLGAAVKIAIASGEIADFVKKKLFYNTVLDWAKMDEYVFLILKYCAYILEHLGFTMEQSMQKNINKLRKRFPEKFTNELANNRCLDAERISLEGKD